MKNERKQLEIMERQLNKALDIILQQKKRLEELNSGLFPWTCEDATDDEVAIGLLGAIGNLNNAIENIYNQ